MGTELKNKIESDLKKILILNLYFKQLLIH
mgnify:CR=1 FL=1